MRPRHGLGWFSFPSSSSMKDGSPQVGLEFIKISTPCGLGVLGAGLMGRHAGRGLVLGPAVLPGAPAPHPWPGSCLKGGDLGQRPRSKAPRPAPSCYSTSRSCLATHEMELEGLAPPGVWSHIRRSSSIMFCSDSGWGVGEPQRAPGCWEPALDTQLPLHLAACCLCHRKALGATAFCTSLVSLGWG